jgi:hypothetical protein
MTTSNDVWEQLGELNEEDAVHTLSRLFVMYEELQQSHPVDEAAALFFRNLSTAISLASECNLNRR